MHLTGWSNGDFNYDGVVNGRDYALIDNTFNQLAATARVRWGSSPARRIWSPRGAHRRFRNPRWVCLGWGQSVSCAAAVGVTGNVGEQASPLFPVLNNPLRGAFSG